MANDELTILKAHLRIAKQTIEAIRKICDLDTFSTPIDLRNKIADIKSRVANAQNVVGVE